MTIGASQSFFLALRKVISSDIVDIDFGICQILDLYLGLVESRLER